MATDLNLAFTKVPPNSLSLISQFALRRLGFLHRTTPPCGNCGIWSMTSSESPTPSSFSVVDCLIVQNPRLELSVV
ncbi:hypothetical protein Scep_010379 [Stephania cephalantha]|uniref:Uncharacterized protein n=1 Tax=Stephania cephalantha TaxID=152367 RepID=A0AAP0JUX4_9MAGN